MYRSINTTCTRHNTQNNQVTYDANFILSIIVFKDAKKHRGSWALRRGINDDRMCYWWASWGRELKDKSKHM